MGEPELDVSVPSLGASWFWNAGYDGGVWDIGVVDTGVDEDHPDLSGHDFYGYSVTSGDSHGTHVAEIVVSTNSTYRGVAYGADAIVSAQAGSMSDAYTAFDWILFSATDDADVANHSWGYGTASSDDTAFSQFFDGLVDNYGVVA